MLKNERDFKKDLEHLLNRHGVDNDLHTPDFMLAELIVSNLKTQQTLLRDREVWHGREFKFMGGKFDTPLKDPPKPRDAVDSEFVDV